MTFLELSKLGVNLAIYETMISKDFIAKEVCFIYKGKQYIHLFSIAELNYSLVDLEDELCKTVKKEFGIEEE